MPRDGGGTYTLPAGNPVIPGTIIETTWANPTMSDIGAALTDSLSRTGSGGMLVPFQNADGSVSLPGITWSNQQNMGFYRPNLDEMRVSVAAVDKARWTSDANDPMDIFVGGMWVAVMNEGGDYTPTGNWDWSNVNSYISPNPLIVSGTDALFSLIGTAGTADEGVWNWRSDGDEFVLASATDAAPLVDVENALIITRVGTAIGPWTFRGGQYDFSDVAASRLLQIIVDGSGALLKSTVGGLDLDAVSASVALRNNGTLRAATGLAGQFDFFADGNSDTEQQMLYLKDSSGNIKAEWGWTNTQTRLHLVNNINGQDFELRGFDFGGNPRTYLFMDPDANTILRADVDLDLQVANGETAFFGTANGKSAMYFNNNERARTLAAASGGLEVDNQDTGGGFERVLTTSDITAPSGNMVFSGYIDDFAIGNNLPAGWSATRTGLGTYKVTHNLGLSDIKDLAIAVTGIGTIGGPAGMIMGSVLGRFTNSFDVQLGNPDMGVGGGGGNTDRNWMFVAQDNT